METCFQTMEINLVNVNILLTVEINLVSVNMPSNCGDKPGKC